MATHWGYRVDSIVGFAVTMKGQDGYNPSSGHLYLDNIYMVGGGTVGVADGQKFNVRPGDQFGIVHTPMLKTYDIRGRLISVENQLHHGRVAGLYVEKVGSGLLAPRAKLMFSK